MTLLRTDSFDHQSSSRYFAGSPSISTVSGARTGTACMLGGSQAQYRVKTADEHATFIAGFAIRTVVNTTFSDLLAFYGDGVTTPHVSITVNNLGDISAYRGLQSGGAFLGVSARGAYTPGTGLWRYVEVKATLSDTVGVVVVHVDEVEVLNLTGLDTKNGGTATVFDSAILWTKSSTDARDDFYLCNAAGSVNNSFLGAVRVAYLGPTGNGNSSVGVGSDGNSTNNFQLVDEVPFDSADYVDFLTTGDEDTYTFADSSFTSSAAVKGVSVVSLAEKLDAGARTIDGVARLAGTESSVTMQNQGDNLAGTAATTDLPNTSYVTMDCVIESKPGGGTWTVNDVNNAEFGVKAT